MVVLFDNEYLRVEHDPAIGLVRVARTALGFPSIEVALSENRHIADFLNTLPIRRLLLDSRLAPGRNDDAFESAMRPIFANYLARFERAAVLVQTAIGKLQMQRLGRAGNAPVRVFSDEAEAIKFLLSDP